MGHALTGTVTLLVVLQLAASARAQAPEAKTAPARTDAFGDPLPEGVFYRLGTELRRHQKVSALLFSAAGTQVLSQGWTDDLRLWEVATGRLVSRFPLPKDLAKRMQTCKNLIASPNDRYLACLAFGTHVILFDKATARELARWEARKDEDWASLAFSRDGKELIGLTAKATVVRWNVADRKETKRTSLDTAKVNVKLSYSWHLSPDGSVAAYLPWTFKPESPVPWHFWDTTTGKQCRQPQQNNIAPIGVYWSAENHLLAVVPSWGDLQVWDTAAGKRLVLTPPPTAKQRAAGTDVARAAAFHPGGKVLAVGHVNRVVVWDLNAGKQLWEKDGLPGNVLAFSRDGKTLGVGGYSAISLFAATSGERVGFSRTDHGTPCALDGGKHGPFLGHGQSLLAYDDAGLSEIAIATGKRLRCLYSRKDGNFFHAELSGDRRRIACAGSDKQGKPQIVIFDAATGKKLWRRPDGASESVFAADGKTLALLGWNGVFPLLDATTGRAIKELRIAPYKKPPYAQLVSHDLRLAATAEGVQKVDLWDLAIGKIIRSLECPRHWWDDRSSHFRNLPVGPRLQFIAGGRMLLAAPYRSASARKSEKGDWTRIWDVASGRVVQSFPEETLMTSADGRWLVLAGDAGKGLAIRHSQTGRRTATLPGGVPLAFSADGSLLALANQSKHEVSLWDTLTGHRVGRWVDPLSEVDANKPYAAFSPDGRILILKLDANSSMLVCDVTGMASEPGKLAARPLTPPEFDRHWADLHGDDGPRSHRARWTLVAGGEGTVKMLHARLRRAGPLDAKRIAALIAALDSDDFEQLRTATEGSSGWSSPDPPWKMRAVAVHRWK